MNIRLLFALSSLFPSCILQQMCVNLVTRQLDISEKEEVMDDVQDEDEALPDNTATNETVLDTEHVRIFIRIRDTNVCQFDIQVLVNLEKNKFRLLTHYCHWQFTEWRVPQIERSFFSSTTTSLPTNDLKNEQNNIFFKSVFCSRF